MSWETCAACGCSVYVDDPDGVLIEYYCEECYSGLTDDEESA